MYNEKHNPPSTEQFNEISKKLCYLAESYMLLRDNKMCMYVCDRTHYYYCTQYTS